MTDQEKLNNASSAGGSAVMLMENTTASRHKSFRPTDLPDDAQVELHHKRSRAPAVPSVAEEYKDTTENKAIKQRKEMEHVKSSEKPKHTVAKISSKRGTSPEAIPMTPIEMDIQRADIFPPAKQPIPAPVGPAVSDISTTKEVNENEDSITEEIAELRAVESSHKEWSDEEAGGLPRSDSRSSRVSRVSRVWRQLFCCGVPYEASSEHNISPRGGGFAGGI